MLIVLLLAVLNPVVGIGDVVGSSYLSGEFWWEAFPFPDGVDYPTTVEEGLELMLEEARWAFSSMVYGLNIHYKPPRPSLSVEEEFRIEPHFLIPWGDPALKVINAWSTYELYRADLELELSEHQRVMRNSWESIRYPVSDGVATHPIYAGFSGRKIAMERAILEAVRNYLRPRFRNIPRSIDGRVVLVEVPQVSIREGAYWSRVRIRLDLKLRPWSSY